MYILTDILKIVLDNTDPFVLILLTGDRDYARAVSILQSAQNQVIFIYNKQSENSLHQIASMAASWRDFKDAAIRLNNSIQLSKKVL